MKKCIVCNIEKPLSDFHNRKSSKDGKQSQCKYCNIARVKKWQAENEERHKENWQRHTSNRSLLVRKARQYNISVEDLTSLLDSSEGKCEICGKEPDRWVVVDHCHSSLKVRGILCEKCNQAIGLFGDSIANLTLAIEYLQKEPLEYREFSPLPRQRYK